MQIVSYGKKIIERRKSFTDEINEIINVIHKKLSGDKEDMIIKYIPYIEADEFEEALNKNIERDIKFKITSVGPHKDDFAFISNGIDLRVYGSQGQQRTAALSLKLSEIELVKKIAKDKPVLLLDDVLSELDSNRQNYLLENINTSQTIITCTGIDDFIKSRCTIDKVFYVTNGIVTEEK